MQEGIDMNSVPQGGVNNKKLYTSSGGEYHSLEVYITVLNLQLANLIGQIVTTMVQICIFPIMITYVTQVSYNLQR